MTGYRFRRAVVAVLLRLICAIEWVALWVLPHGAPDKDDRPAA